MTGVATEFDTVLSHGDDCPVCDRTVAATVEGNNCTALNDECVQYDRDGRARYIFHGEDQ